MTGNTQEELVHWLWNPLPNNLALSPKPVLVPGMDRMKEIACLILIQVLGIYNDYFIFSNEYQ